VGNSALHTHIPNIAVFAHQNHQMEVAMGRFKDQPAGTDVTKLETSMSFLQIKASLGLHEKTRDLTEQEGDRPGEARGHSWGGQPLQPPANVQEGAGLTKSGAVAYVMRCNPVEVLPRVSNNCTEEIPVTWNGTSLYGDPISYVIKSAASPHKMQ
jgi:hypothetical protein